MKVKSFCKAIFNFKNIAKLIVYIRVWGLRSGYSKMRTKLNSMSLHQSVEYQKWLKYYINKHPIKTFSHAPLISILIHYDSENLAQTEQTIASIQNQYYTHCEIILVGTNDIVVLPYQYENTPKHFPYSHKNLIDALNTGAEIAQGEYVLFMGAGDVLLPTIGLQEWVSFCKKNRHADLIYADEYATDEQQKQVKQFFLKPAFCIELLRTQNYIGTVFLIKKNFFHQLHGFNTSLPSSQQYDLLLRASEATTQIVHIQKTLYSSASSSVLLHANREVLEAHFTRQNIKAEVVSTSIQNVFKINYALLHSPLVSIIIGNKNSTEIFTRCIDSILAKTTYSNYEIIIVENNSTDENIFAYYKTIKKDKRIRIIDFSASTFNYSALNNEGVRKSKGEIVLLLNNDTEIITPNWIDEMLVLCQQADVGIVGAKLLYANGTIQHCGVAITKQQHIIHPFLNASANASVRMNSLFSTHSVSALTGACLMIKKQDYEQANGLDEKHFKIICNDIDLCFKLGQLKKRNLITPHAILYHHESLSRGFDLHNITKAKRQKQELDFFFQKWQQQLPDPFWNEGV